MSCHINPAVKYIDWQEEYELFCDVDIDEESFVPWYNVQDEIKRCEKTSRKKRKHVNDDTRWVESNKHFWNLPRHRSLCICEWCKDNIQHKHLRAQRVYLEEECNPYYEEWLVNTSYDDDCWDYGDYEYDRDFWDDDWLEEVGLENFRSDFDWEEYSECKSPEGCKVDMKDYTTCAYCGNTHNNCECFK
jgi:hypothetical protein